MGRNDGSSRTRGQLARGLVLSTTVSCSIVTIKVSGRSSCGEGFTALSSNCRSGLSSNVFVLIPVSSLLGPLVGQALFCLRTTSPSFCCVYPQGGVSKVMAVSFGFRQVGAFGRSNSAVMGARTERLFRWERVFVPHQGQPKVVVKVRTLVLSATTLIVDRRTTFVSPLCRHGRDMLARLTSSGHGCGTVSSALVGLGCFKTLRTGSRFELLSTQLVLHVRMFIKKQLRRTLTKRFYLLIRM